MANEIAVIKPQNLTAKQIDDAIANIASRGKKLDDFIQQTALSIILHIDNHGDISKANMLFNAMPKGSRRNALAEWFIRFGKLKVSKAEDKKVNPFAFNKKAETNFEEAAALPWFKCRPEKAVDQVFDIQVKLIQLLNQAKKAQEAGREIKAHGIDLGELERMVGKAG